MRILIFVFILLITINFASAEINIFKEEYKLGETFQAELNFKNLLSEIKVSDIKITNADDEVTNIGVLFTKIDNERYFIYFEIPKIESGEYKLVINNVRHISDGILKKENFEQVFKVKNAQNDIISIKPGYIILRPEERGFFKFDIKNNGKNIVTINFPEENFTKFFAQNITLTPDSFDSVYFNVKMDEIKETEKLNIKLKYNNNSFLLPIFIVNSYIKNNLMFFVERNNMKNYLDYYNVDLEYGSYAEGSIILENTLNKNLTNLIIILAGNINEILKPGFYEINSLKSKEIIELNLFFNLNGNAKEGEYEGNLVVKNEDIKSSLPIKINVLKSELYQETIEEKTNLNISESNFKEIALEPAKNQSNLTVPKVKNKLNKKIISYILIILMLIIFIAIYVLIFLKIGKPKKRKFSDLIRR